MSKKIDALNDYFYCFKDNLRRSFRAEGPCIASVELGEFLSIPAGVAGSLAIRAGFGIFGGTAVMTTALTGDEEIGEEKENPTLYREFLRSYQALKAGVKRAYHTWKVGSPEERSELKRDLKRNMKTAIFGELFGCIGASAITEAAIISVLGGGVVAWGASLIPTYFIGSMVVASKLAYDGYVESKVVGRLELPEEKVEEFVSLLEKEYGYGRVKKDKKGRTKRLEFQFLDGENAVLHCKPSQKSSAILSVKLPELRYGEAVKNEQYERLLGPVFEKAEESLGAKIIKSRHRKHRH